MVTRIALVGDHPATVLGLTTLLNVNPALQVVATTTTAAELTATGDPLDVVVFDLDVKDAVPRRDIAALNDAGAAVLVYAHTVSGTQLTEVADAGAAGLIRKAEPPASIVRAVHAAARGERLTATEWAQAASGRRAKCARLTKRESQVLTHYAAGGSAEKVGEALFVTRETVHDHIRRIRAKYAAAGRPSPTKVDLFRRAIEDGLVDLSGQPAIETAR